MTKKTNGSTFFWGLLIGGLIYLILWYWQKSTSAEDGALEMLDRLAEQGAELARLRTETAVSPPLTTPTRSTSTAVPPFLDNNPTKPAAADDLTQIKGIGAVFATKLQAAGLTTISAVAMSSAEQLAAILEIGDRRAAAIVEAAVGIRNP